MFGKKLVSDALLATVKEVTSGEQIDSTGNQLLVGNGVTVQEGPHEGRRGTISGFHNTGRSEVQLNHGPSVALYNETLLNEAKSDPSTGGRERSDLHKFGQSRISTQGAREGKLTKAVQKRLKSRSRDRLAQKEDYEVDEALTDAELKKAGERQRADLTKTVPAGQPYSKTDAAYKQKARWDAMKTAWRAQQRGRKAERDRKDRKLNNEYEIDEDQKLKKLSNKMYNDSHAEVSNKKKWANKDFDHGHDSEVDNAYKKRVDAHVKKNPKHKAHFYGEEIEYEELVFDHHLLDRLLAEAGFDVVDKKALKKKWKDREDQDIDNDGDEDESDRYLHKRRKAIAKSKKKKNGNGNGNGEKVEINPEIKEAIRKLIHSTLK